MSKRLTVHKVIIPNAQANTTLFCKLATLSRNVFPTGVGRFVGR